MWSGQHQSIHQLVNAARSFMTEPLGAQFSDAIRRGNTTFQYVGQILPHVLVALHLFREEQKLSNLSNDKTTLWTGDLTPVLAQLGRWMGWTHWDWKKGTYYNLDGAGVDCQIFENGKSVMLVSTYNVAFFLSAANFNP